MVEKLAIMQPYIFPYIGYLQLINSVDSFIFLDDVNFIKKGWIHRNEFPIGDSTYTFSIPLKKKSQNKLISETFIHEINYKKWKENFYKTLNEQYKSAKNYGAVNSLVRDVFDSPEHNIARLAADSVIKTCKYLEIETKFKFSSNIDIDETLRGQARIIEFCKKEKTTDYINLSGGKDLYHIKDFRNENLKLKFIRLKDLKTENDFFSKNKYFSIIHLLMHLDKSEIRYFLNFYETE